MPRDVTLPADSTDTIALDNGIEVPLMEASTLIHCPCADQLVDLSTRDCADDVSQALPLSDTNPFRAAGLCQEVLHPLCKEARGPGRLHSECG